MTPTEQSSVPTPQWDELSLSTEPDAGELDNIKTHLDLILLALEALTQIGSEEILTTAKELNLETMISDRVGLWRLRQSNPKRKSSGGRKKLDVEEARSLVLIIANLAKQHHQQIRQTVALLEKTALENQQPHRVRQLGDYLDTFSNTYEERMHEEESLSGDELSNLALKLLIDLLFYSAPQGHRRLWIALLDRS